MKRKITLGLAAASTAVPLLAGGIAFAADTTDATGHPAVVSDDTAAAPDRAALVVDATDTTDTGTDLPPETVAAYAAFWDAGYNYDQLLALAEEWNLDEYQAKAHAGELILAGDTSEIDSIVAGIGDGEPGSSPVDAFFDAGYTYDDAVELAEEWNTDSYQAKVHASELIANGQGAEIDALLAD